MTDNYNLYTSFNQIVIEESNSSLSNVFLKRNFFEKSNSVKKLNKHLKRAYKIAKSVSNYYTYDAYKLLDTIDVMGFIEQLSNHHYYVKHVIAHKKRINDIVIESVVYKRGFNNNRFRTKFATINLDELNKFFNDGDIVTPEILKERGIIKNSLCGIKVLANGNLDKKLTIKAQRFSSKAVTKIEEAGGKAEVI